LISRSTAPDSSASMKSRVCDLERELRVASGARIAEVSFGQARAELPR
jgi:hypothetical protein